MPGNPSNFGQFWQELKRRRVVRVIIVYGATAFVILELVDIVSPSLGLPLWTLNFIIVLLSVGFFITVILSWVYDITPRGIIKTKPIQPAHRQKENYPQTDKSTRFKNSIAVLPFQDMSPQKDQEYFCDGMTEEIINALTHIDSLKVIARTSAFAFKDKHKDIREIGKKLDVETVLEGSIRKDGNRLRITAQLIKVDDGYHLWADAYNRELEDVFAIQEEISLAIVDNLKVNLLGKEKAGLVKRYTENLEIYNLILTGRYFQNKGTEEGGIKAIEYFEKAIEKAPDSAQAFAEMASCYVGLGSRDFLPPKSAFPKAREAVLRAIELDKSLSEAHVSLGLIKTMFDWDWQGAEREFKQAIQLNSNYAPAYSGYSYYLTATGRLDEAIRECEKAIELDPLSAVLNDPLNIALLRAGRFKQARRQLEKLTYMEPNYPHAWWVLGQTYISESRFEEGISKIEKALDLSKNNALILSGLGWAYAISSRKSDAKKVIDELKGRMKNEYIRPYLFAKIYASLGEIDQSFEWLDKAYDEHDVSLAFMLNDETLAMLHSDQRFNRLLNKINLIQ